MAMETTTEGCSDDWLFSLTSVVSSSTPVMVQTTAPPDDLAPTTNFTLNDSAMTSEVPDDVFLPWANPYNVITQQTLLSFEEAMMCGVSVALFLLGGPLNVINCLVFYRQGLKDRMNLSLFCLALVDLLYLLFFFLVSSFCPLGRVLRPDLAQWWKYFARKYFTGLYRGFLYSSGCLTALISLERCVCVVLPLKFHTLVKTRTMGVIIAVIVLSLQLAALLYPLNLSIGSRTDPDTGEVSYFLSSSDFFRENRTLYTVVEDTLLMVVIPFGTFIIVSVSTAVTVLELRLRQRWRESTTTSAAGISRQQMTVVRMLVVVSCFYILTAAPNLALGLARSLVPEFLHTRRYANIFLLSHLAWLMLAMLSSSFNFFVYLVMSSRFRHELGKLFLGRKGQLLTSSAAAASQPRFSSAAVAAARAKEEEAGVESGSTLD